ncbi:unnamed protein product [Mytilus coruscus]|uniref:Uncharacterized protein n=1 Tax=Mytilus coruscus TaxID=42192 RepID=A0A6J8ENY7_MYTCO|nr:unnamed protein product [Mytilus coruscus]
MADDKYSHRVRGKMASTGSSKGMEPDMACSMIQRLAEDGYTVGTLHADNDATTQSRLPRSIIKKDDKTHVKKNLSKRLYGLSKNYKQLKSAKVIPYIVRCFMYAISRHQNCKQSMKAELATIVPHIFGHHEQCSPTWCTYIKDPTKFRFKHLPNGKALSGDKLKEELDKLAQSYIERADRLLNLGSTQSNESFNNSVASFAQKTGMPYITLGFLLIKVNKKSLLSPGHLTILHGIRKDRRQYDAHNACADVTSLFQLLEHFEYSEKDVFPFNAALLTDSYIPLIRASHITKLTARRLAHSGLCLKHLQLAFNRDSENGLKSILLEHGFNAKTVTSFTKYFTCTEE